MRRNVLAPLLLLLLGVAASVGAGLNVRDEAQQDLESRLESDAQSLGMLFQSLGGSFETGLASVASVALITDGDPAAHDRYSSLNTQAGVHALVDLSQASPVVVAVTGPGVTEETSAAVRAGVDGLLGDAAVRDELIGTGDGSSFRIFTDHTGDSSVMSLAAVARDGARAYAAISQIDLGPAGMVVPNAIEGIEGFALYLGEEAAPAQAILASTDALPLTGTTSRTSIAIAGQKVLVEVNGTPQPPVQPLAVAAVGIVASVLVAASWWHALRRRDAALAALELAERAEERFRVAIEASPDAILLWRKPQDELRVLNRDELFGWAVGEITRPWDLVRNLPEEERDRLSSVCTAPALTTTVATDVCFQAADGSEACAHVRFSPMNPSHPSESDVLVVVTDTTEARKAEQQRAELEASLNQAQRMETIGQLAGGIAHDFNNLLAAISSTAELIAGDVDDANVRRDVQEIIAATHRGAALTRRLLTFSRRNVSTEQPLDVGSVLTSVGSMVRRMLDERIDLDLSIPDAPLTVLGDPGELEQVMLNLIVNARDAQQGVGHRISVAADERDGLVEITVTDNGRGMSPDIRERAFEPFFTTKDPDKGTGLGLAIVYGIVSRMGGAVRVDSTEGEGTTVLVELPSITGPAPIVEPVAELEPEALVERRESVLLVEDEPAVCRAAQRLIERAGHIVHSAHDGEQALDIVRGGLRPTVLVTDVVLPGSLTGRDVAEAVRGWVPGIRVIYASGYAREVITADDLLDDGVAFIPKPFTSAALLGAITDHQGAAV